MRVLFVFADVHSEYGVPKHPCLAFAILSGVLKKCGHEVEVFDQRLGDEGLQGLIDEFRPDFVGFHVTILNYKNTLKLRESVKISCKTIVGGPHASVCPDDFKVFDFVVVGEGENALLDIVEGKITEHVVSRPVSDINVLPDWSCYPDYKYTRLPLFITRGCPYSCIFCNVNKIFGRSYRKRELANVLDEVKAGIEMGIKYFDVVDDCFTLDKNYVKEFCKLVKPLGITWECTQGARIDTLDEEAFFAMKDAGCILIAVGIESGNQKIVDNIKKGLNLEVAKKNIAFAKKAGLRVKAFFLVGSPGETYEDVLLSIKFFKENKIDLPRFGVLAPYPHTELWEWAQANAVMLVQGTDNYTHGAEGKDRVVPYETSIFKKEEVLKAINLATKEADTWAMRMRLGPVIGFVMRIDWLRNLMKKIYFNSNFIKGVMWK